LAAKAASAECGHGWPLHPNPPPTNGLITWTLSAGNPNVSAKRRALPTTPWVASYATS